MMDETKLPEYELIIPPKLGSVQLVNDGSSGWSAEINDAYYTSYQSNIDADDIIGNVSPDKLTWSPSLNNTDPPSHFVFVQRDFATDCAFYPAMDEFDGLFSIAWLESQPTGRINLKYSDFAPGNFIPPPVPNPPGSTNPVNQHTFYIYPRILKVGPKLKTENIAFSDMTVVDIYGNTFKVNLNDATKSGVELTMPGPVSSFRWTQSFRESGKFEGILTSIPTEDNNYTSAPLVGIAINIYFGNIPGHVYRRLITNDKGYFSTNVGAMQYLLEVESQSLSINVAQQLL